VYNGTQETLETSLSKYSSDLYTFDLDCDCNLPLELFLHIFYFLNQSDLVHKIALLNKCFRQLIFNQKLSHLVWDFRLIHFNSSADCVDVCVKKKLITPQHLRIRSYKSLEDLLLILNAVQHKIHELRIKDYSIDQSAPAARDVNLEKMLLSKLKLPELRRIALYRLYERHIFFMTQILFAAPQLSHIEYVPFISMIYKNPNLNYFTHITVCSFDVLCDVTQVQASISQLQKLRTFEVKDRIDKDIVEQVLALPLLAKVSIYCGKTLRKTVNHFRDSSQIISPNLKKAKFTKYKSCSNFLEKTGSQMTHLQLYTCNPIHTSVNLSNYSQLTYLASFKSMTIAQLRQVATNCKQLEHFYFKPVYPEQGIQLTDWELLLVALSGSNIRHFGLTSVNFDSKSSAGMDWFSLLIKYLPKLKSIIFASIMSNENEETINLTDYKPLNKLRRYDITGSEKSGINHSLLFARAPNLSKVVFKHRDMTFEELFQLSRRCLKLRELIVDGTIRWGPVRTFNYKFNCFERLSKVSITSFDGSNNSVSDVLLAALCLCKASEFNISVTKASEMWKNSHGISPSGRDIQFIQQYIRSQGNMLINEFEEHNGKMLQKLLEESIQILGTPAMKLSNSLIAACLIVLCPPHK